MMYWFSFVDKKEKTICNRHGDWIVPKNPALVSAKDVALSGWTQYNFFMLCRFQGLPTHRGGSLGISERKRAKGHKVVSGDQSIALFSLSLSLSVESARRGGLVGS